MAIQFDASKVAMFREAQLANADTMTRLDGNGRVVANGQYKLFTSWRTRTGEDRIVNNEVRTALLKALGQAFNIKEGVRDEDGKIFFSRTFMERLEGILGRKTLKAADFDVGDDGLVKSGKPLTKRRITAILDKAIMTCKTNFDVDIYMAKLATIKQELGLGPIPQENGKDKFAKKGKNLFWVVERGLNLLKNEIFLAKTVIDKNTGKPKPIFGPKGEPKDRSFMRVNPGWKDMIESNMDPESYGYTRYELRAPDGGYVPFNKTKRDEMLRELIASEVIHIEHAPVTDDDLESMEREKRYIASIVQQFVQKMVDTYFEAKATGRLNAFLNHLSDRAGGCMEEKCKRLEEFQRKNFGGDVAPGEKMSQAEIAELERIADEDVGENAPASGAHNLVYGVINALYTTDNAYAGKGDWKDFAPHAKEKLLGKTAQIVKPELDEVRNEYKFVPVKDIQDKPVVRPLTAEDIDEIGRACLYNTVGGDEEE